MLWHLFNARKRRRCNHTMSRAAAQRTEKGGLSMSRLPKIWLVLLVFALLACLSTPALAEDVARGKLQGVYPDKHALVITQSQAGQWVVFNLDKNSKVLINNVPSDPMDLRMGEDVVIIYDKQMDTPVASVVRVRR
jgi:hypothetical protein